MKSTLSHKYIFTILFVLSLTHIIGQSIWNDDIIKDIKLINEVGINSPNMETSPCFFNERIAFVFTDRKGKFYDRDLDEAFFDCGYADIDSTGKLYNKMAFDKKINADLHRGPMAYDKNLNTLYFTKTIKETRRVKGIIQDTAYLHILSANLSGNKPVINKIDLKEEKYSVAHPTLTADGKSMIFSSNNPEGNGGMDLYMAFKDGEEWKSIVNLGKGVNGQNNEIFPFLLNDTILIFASDRVGGMGGLDMYVSVLSNGIWSSSTLIPAPFNSPYDDLGLIVSPDGRSGYMASNRPGGKGKDDIFSFRSSEPIIQGYGDIEISNEEIHITVLDKFSLNPVPNARVTLTPISIFTDDISLDNYSFDMLSEGSDGEVILKLKPKKGIALPEAKSDIEGIIKIKLSKAQKYLISASSDLHDSTNLIYDMAIYGSNINIVLEPKPSEDTKNDTIKEKELIPIYIPTRAGESVVFDQILYDFNSYEIAAGAAYELDALANTMKNYPSMHIRLEAHTDSRGTKDYNLKLSTQRAQSAAQYLIGQGIDSDRIQIIGFGENNLRNQCTDGVACSEAEHQYNRRTEVVILKNE